jgi:hypothetical protein
MILDPSSPVARRLGADWPVPSVNEAVMARIDSPSVPRPRRVPVTRRRAVLCAAAALLAADAAAAWLLVLGTPRTLQAQVQQALAKTSAAHVVISTLDDKGVRQQGEIWYERGRGFRAESPDEIILDDGRQQWTWRPGVKEGERVIARRRGHDAVGMITGMFQLGNAPAAWGRERAPEHERALPPGPGAGARRGRRAVVRRPRGGPRRGRYRLRGDDTVYVVPSTRWPSTRSE